MNEDIQKDIEFYLRVVKDNGMAITSDVSDVCNRETKLDAIKHPQTFRFVNCVWRNDEEIASRAIQSLPENFL